MKEILKEKGSVNFYNCYYGLKGGKEEEMTRGLIRHKQKQQWEQLQPELEIVAAKENRLVDELLPLLQDGYTGKYTSHINRSKWC